MKKRKKIPKNAAHRVSRLLDVPLDMVADVPRITLNDNRELTVENYKSVEGYEPEEIRLRSTKYHITVSGKALTIIAITDEEIFISGTITNISLT